MKRYVLLFIGFCVLTSASYNERSKARIKVLIVDGQNNHVVWPKSTIMMKQYLEDTGLFVVDIERTHYLHKSEQFKDWLPYAGISEGIEGKPKTDPDFSPNFSNYDVVISNFGWQAASWPEKTKQNFENFVKNGGGFVSVHGANNSFPKWRAYNEMIAVGGWGDRTEKDGPYLYVDKMNRVKRDSTPGAAGKHGKREAFLVTTFNSNHPITVGLPEEWMHATDECYAYLRGPAKNVTILATAVSKVKAPELEQKEPVAMVIDYGKGRIFHTTLGHDSIAFECVGFQTLLIRGIEWAATGDVSPRELPKDFPSASQVSTRDFQHKS
ncbi:ThuA domain-containing protein [Cognatitamlana onchidii]|uniref:ThuA domain-containing protein n=1 Tax=Cognatitamlana onchidii TaxID=2562860 RepID=UPI0010A63B42|nr:ThuA domain-containing protein [Algibacter onchidii]